MTLRSVNVAFAVTMEIRRIFTPVSPLRRPTGGDARVRRVRRKREERFEGEDRLEEFDFNLLNAARRNPSHQGNLVDLYI